MSICSALRRAAGMAPNKPAFLCDDRAVTWSDLHHRAQKVAGALAQMGLKPGGRVAVVMGNSMEYAELFAGVAWAGGVIVPLNTRWTAKERREAIEDCGASIVITSEEFAAEAKDHADAFGIRRISTGGAFSGAEDYEAIVTAADPLECLESPSDELFAIFYTGGTTGRSKGVMLSHACLYHGVLVSIAEGAFGRDARYLLTSPSFHIAGASAIVGMFVSTGTGVVLPRFTAEAVIEAVERHGVNETLLVPAMIQAVIDHPQFDAGRFRSLRRLIYGASPITQALLERTMSRLPGTQIMQMYGMTETSGQFTMLHHSRLTDEDAARGRNRSAGVPTPGMEIAILDDQGQHCAVGQFGEICCRGPSVMMGYWRQPDATKDALRDGWMHTGDGGYLDEDGYLFVSDRIKDMIVTGGENVFSVEVENALAKHPAISNCAVFAVPHEKWIEQVHAAVVLRPGATADADELIAFCRDHLAGYKIPRGFDFLDELPMSGPGKIFKRALREPYWK